MNHETAVKLFKAQALDELVSQIAKDALGIETLETQNRDSLDFHDVHVAAIKKALKAAYEAGQQSAKKAAR